MRTRSRIQCLVYLWYVMNKSQSRSFGCYYSYDAFTLLWKDDDDWMLLDTIYSTLVCDEYFYSVYFVPIILFSLTLLRLNNSRSGIYWPIKLSSPVEVTTNNTITLAMRLRFSLGWSFLPTLFIDSEMYHTLWYNFMSSSRTCGDDSSVSDFDHLCNGFKIYYTSTSNLSSQSYYKSGELRICLFDILFTCDGMWVEVTIFDAFFWY